MEESAITMLVTIFVFMLGFGIARMSSDKMTIKECLASTATVVEMKSRVEKAVALTKAIEKAHEIGVGDEWNFKNTRGNW